MTHLYIELNTSGIEEVNASIIAKLYELASSGTLDGTSDLKGRLSTPHCRELHYNYFTKGINNSGKRFPDLYLTVTEGVYLDFADPVMASYWANSEYGNGEGITESSAAAVTTFPGADSIGGNQFRNNSNITSFNELKLFTNITTIPPRCFLGSTLSSIDLSNITEIYNNAFLDTNLHGVINLPKLTKLGTASGHGTNSYGNGWTFAGCAEITEVNIGSQVPDDQKMTTVLDQNIFRACTNLAKVTGLNKLQIVGAGLFKGCPNLTSVDLDFQNITEILLEAFLYSGISGILNLDSLTTIGASAFMSCTGLTEVNFNNSLINIGSSGNIFNGCSNLEKVTGLSNTTKLIASMFGNCENLSTIDIDFSKITELGARVFESCTSLDILNLSIPNLTKTVGEKCFYRVPISAVSNLGSCTEIGINAFNGITTLTSVTLPNTVTKIGGNAFQNCSNLQTINIPSSVTQIDGHAFYGCSNLIGTFNLSNVTTFSGPQTFRDCRNVTISGFPRSLVYNERVFLHIGNTSIIIPNTVTTIGVAAFMYCYNLLTLSFESNSQLQTIDTVAFSSCTALLSVVLPEGLTTIDGKIFEGCSALTSVDIPSTVTYIGNEVFRSTPVTTLIVRATTPPSVHNYIFNGLSSSCTIYVPAASVNTYKNAATWSTRASHIQAISA